MSKKKNKIKKSDYNRVLITETTPFETPIIFSNEGVYDRLNDLNPIEKVQHNILSALLQGKYKANESYTIPYFYKIRKDSSSLRRLALPHPRAQWRMKEFYSEFENLIIYHCTRSPASIRAPVKIAGSFFFPNSYESMNQYKEAAASTVGLDQLTKHSPTFFAYKSYDRLYKFFESKDYFELEKNYSLMKTLDVTKCFDSIYTHSISWAIKDKEYIKKFARTAPTFGQEFDGLMCYCNHGETNGIVIGPEISRIFAEIIFQEIDSVSINKIEANFNYKFGIDYCFRRYVDDVFIFANNEKIINVVYDNYADTLNSFNLHASPSKTILIKRPFVTEKSRLIQDASLHVNEFINKFLYSTDDNARILKPLKIRSAWRLTRSFVESIKVLCSYNSASYDKLSTFLIAVFTERIKKLVAIQKISEPDNEAENYISAFIVLLEIIYFLYQISPSVGASYKLSTSIILTIRFFKNHLPDYLSTITQKIFDLTESLILEINRNTITNVDGVIQLEILNIALDTRELDSIHLMPPSLAEKIFIASGKHSYFSIICCLFYVRDEGCYSNVRDLAIAAACNSLEDLSDINMCSEKAHLLLDLLTCPYVPEELKRLWIKEAFQSLNIPTPTTLEINHFLSKAPSIDVHVDWKQVDLLRALEKKELKQAY